ncbi:MAG TPA: hypothetical protein PLN69_08620 [bacterium]|nr:hypothetical protein [bacterium]
MIRILKTILILLLLASPVSVFADVTDIPDTELPMVEDSMPEEASAPVQFYAVRFKGVEKKLVDDLLPMLSKKLFDIPVVLLAEDVEVPPEAFVKARNRYYAGTILDLLEKMNPDDSFGIIGFVEESIFVGRINVNGVGNPHQNAAVVSTHRLKDVSWYRFRARVLNESVHEMGHLFWIEHCLYNSCAMKDVRDLAELDVRNSYFCPYHLKQAYNYLVGKGAKLPPLSNFKEEKIEKEFLEFEDNTAPGEDNEPPVVISIYPSDGEVVKPDFGSIRAQFEDGPGKGTGVDSKGVLTYLNGAPITTYYHDGKQQLAAPVGRLDPGEYYIEIFAIDYAGNTMPPFNSSFTVEE